MELLGSLKSFCCISDCVFHCTPDHMSLRFTSLCFIHNLFFLICRYPPNDLPDVVVSELEVWEVNSHVSVRCFSLSYWRSVLNRRHDYNIILKQQDLDAQGKVKASATFVLHETRSQETSQQAFEEIHSTLKPLVDDGSVMMSEKLLEGIITPKPTEPSRLVFEIVEIMDKNVSV